MTSLTVDLTYSPRDYQGTFEKAMLSGKSRALLVWHRRAGKDIAAINFMAMMMLKTKGIYYYLFPTFRQARGVIWDGLDEDGRSIVGSAFPPEIIEAKNETQMKIRLINGSIFQLIGTDNYDSIAGTNPIGVVFSEYSLQDPNAWNLIVSPILAKNGGWAVFVGTPRGKNHQYDLDNIAKQYPDRWFYQKLTIEDTGLIPLDVIEQERKEGKSEELIQQEYYCSYDRGVEGSYYGRLLDAARKEKRCGTVAYEPRSNVNTAWDIGYGDSTAIVFWQSVGTEVRIIDYYEAHGEGIAHYLKLLQNKPYVYGSHYFPHDAGSGSIQTGKTLQKVVQELGFNPIVLPRDDLEVGIETTRALLAICYIDETKCGRLLKCLENYCKTFNEKLNVYSSTPLHNWASHGADAVRYMAMARRMYGQGNNTLSPDAIRDMRRRNQGY